MVIRICLYCMIFIQTTIFEYSYQAILHWIFLSLSRKNYNLNFLMSVSLSSNAIMCHASQVVNIYDWYKLFCGKEYFSSVKTNRVDMNGMNDILYCIQEWKQLGWFLFCQNLWQYFWMREFKKIFQPRRYLVWWPWWTSKFKKGCIEKFGVKNVHFPKANLLDVACVRFMKTLYFYCKFIMKNKPTLLFNLSPNQKG